ncbi:MAG: hypothetical protein IKE43_10800 [Coriobacteriales bacterium]|nr:hypothetical protein [Coriobacteriales bacterium]
MSNALRGYTARTGSNTHVSHEEVCGSFPLTRRAFVRLAGITAASCALGILQGPKNAAAFTPEDALRWLIGYIEEQNSPEAVKERAIRNAYQVYLSRLIEDRLQIRDYSWQDARAGTDSPEGGGEDAPGTKGQRHVALFDIDGDDIPELFYMEVQNDSSRNAIGARLVVLGCTDQGDVRTIFDSPGCFTCLDNPLWALEDSASEGNTEISLDGKSQRPWVSLPEGSCIWDVKQEYTGNYCFFTSGENEDLYVIVTLSKEGYAQSNMFRLAYDQNTGTLVQQGAPLVEVTRKDAGGSYATSWYLGLDETSKEQFAAAQNAVLDQATQVVMYNASIWGYSETLGQVKRETGIVAQPYGGTVDTITQKLGIAVVPYLFQGTPRGERIDRTLNGILDNTASTEYSPRLAHLLIALATAAYDRRCVADALCALGCSKSVRLFNYSGTDDPFDPSYPKDAVGYAIGQGETTDGRPLVIIAVRGTYGEIDIPAFLIKMVHALSGIDIDFKSLTPDWASNLNLGVARTQKAWHGGFYAAYAEVFDTLLEQFGQYGVWGNVFEEDATFVVCGHSRGAAVANLLEVGLGSYGVPRERIYGYNFACPDCARDDSTAWNPHGAHDNIFNIGNANDAVSMVPGALGTFVSAGSSGIEFFLRNDPSYMRDLNAVWGKYGRSYWFAESWTDVDVLPLDFASHEPTTYLDILRNEPSLSEFKDYAGIKGSGIVTAMIRAVVQASKG